MNSFRKIFFTLSVILVFCIPLETTVNAEPNVSDLFDDKDNDDQKVELEQDVSKDSAPIAGKDESLFLDLLKMVMMLAIVLALIYFLLKFLQKRNRLFQQAKSLENLGGINLGSNKSVQLVRIGNKVFVIGVGENVQLLTELDDETLIQELLENRNSLSPVTTTFPAFIKQWKESKGDKTVHSSSFKQLFNKELHNLKQERRKIIEQTKGKGDQNE
jgi:flagellar protein FliO/FliZ